MTLSFLSLCCMGRKPSKCAPTWASIYDDCRMVEKRIKDFTESLFIMLKTNWLYRAPNKSREMIPLLCILFEKEDFMALDTDSSTFVLLRPSNSHMNCSSNKSVSAEEPAVVVIETTLNIRIALGSSAIPRVLYSDLGMCVVCLSRGLTSNGIHPDTSTDTGRAQNCLSPEDTTDK